MARLIDGDALKENVIQGHNDTLSALHATWAKALAHAMTFAFLANINNAPTVDAVAVVRCGECKHREEKTFWCEKVQDFISNPEWFCADGERKGGDE